MKLLASVVALYVVYRLIRRKAKRLVAREEYHEPPEGFTSLTIPPSRPPSLVAAATEQRQFDSSGIDEQL